MTTDEELQHLRGRVAGLTAAMSAVIGWVAVLQASGGRSVADSIDIIATSLERSLPESLGELEADGQLQAAAGAEQTIETLARIARDMIAADEAGT